MNEHMNHESERAKTTQAKGQTKREKKKIRKARAGRKGKEKTSHRINKPAKIKH